MLNAYQFLIFVIFIIKGVSVFYNNITPGVNQGDKLSNCSGLRGSDCMVDGFTISDVTSTYHHWCCEFESRSGRRVQRYVTGRCFSPVSFIDTTDCHDIAEMLLKVALNTTKQAYQIISTQDVVADKGSFAILHF